VQVIAFHCFSLLFIAGGGGCAGIAGGGGGCAGIAFHCRRRRRRLRRHCFSLQEEQAALQEQAAQALLFIAVSISLTHVSSGYPIFCDRVIELLLAKLGVGVLLQCFMPETKSC
jgi:hypothetical protein